MKKHRCTLSNSFLIWHVPLILAKPAYTSTNYAAQSQRPVAKTQSSAPSSNYGSYGSSSSNATPTTSYNTTTSSSTYSGKKIWIHLHMIVTLNCFSRSSLFHNVLHCNKRPSNFKIPFLFLCEGTTGGPKSGWFTVTHCLSWYSMVIFTLVSFRDRIIRRIILLWNHLYHRDLKPAV